MVVLLAADGGFLSLDGGVAIVQGPAGPQGPQGVQGPKGDTGDAGPKGQAGQSVVGSSEPAGTNCSYGGVRYDSVSGTAYVCNGAPGSTGPQGPAGDAGPPGPKGDTGAMGPVGPRGPGLTWSFGDGGYGGVILGTNLFYLSSARCSLYLGQSTLAPITPLTLHFTSTNCTGQPYAQDPPVPECFYARTMVSPGVSVYRVVQPVALNQLTFQSSWQAGSPGCELITPFTGNAVAVELAGIPNAVPVGNYSFADQ